MRLFIVPDLGRIVPIMGKHNISSTPSAVPAALADALFTPVQQRVLGLLYGHVESH